MSRIGNQPVTIENGATVEIVDGGKFNYKQVVVKGPKGELSQDIQRGIKIEVKDDQVIVTRESDNKRHKSLHGLYRSLIQNLIEGVTKGYVKELELHGVGYRVNTKGNDLEFNLGLNHPILFSAPEGISFEVKDQVDLKVSGIDKQLVGETAAKIREMRKPEPYKGKGIRYKGEYVRRKAGKTAGSAA